MAAITSTVLAIGGMAYKGFSAIDAAKSQSREAGRLTDQAEELERQALADLEQNRLEAVQVPLQIFDTTNELQTLDGVLVDIAPVSYGGKAIFNVSNLATGLYILKVSNGENTVVKKVSVSH